MLWKPRFIAGATDFTLTTSSRPWVPRTATVGGVRKSATGVPASYIVRRDHVLVLPLRFYESEWSNVHAMIAYGQGSESITWYPDAATPGTNFACYLDAPAAGTDITPQRAQDFPKVFEITIELRRTDGAIWALEYFADS